MDSSLNKFSKLNDSIISFLEKPIIKYGFLILIIVQIIVIKDLSTSYLQIFDDNYFKIIYAFVIAYYACFDPIYSIALTTLMIISIQEIHRRNANTNSISLIQTKKYSNINNNNNNSENEMPINSNSINKSINKFINSTSDNLKNEFITNDDMVYETINRQILQKKPSSDDNLKHEYEFCDQPAYKTITNNLNETDNENNEDINNLQNISIQGLQGDIETIQGLPNGYESRKIK
jgi:hypothetical protein